MLNRTFVNITLLTSVALFLVQPTWSYTDFQSLYDSAKKQRSAAIGEKALKIAEEDGHTLHIAKAHFLIAFYQDENRMYYEALNHYFSSQIYYDELKNYGKQIGILMNIGTIYRIGGFYDKAIEFYSDAQALALQVKDYKRLRKVNYQMGRTHRMFEGIEEAKKLYLELLLEKDSIKGQVLLSDTYLELALIAHSYDNDYVTAKEYLNEAVRQYEGISSPEAERTRMTRINDLGYIHILEGQAGKSIPVFLDAISKSTNDNRNQSILVKLYGNLSRAYKEVGQLDSSIQMLEKGLNLAPLQSFEKSFIRTAKVLHDHYKSRSEEKADHYVKLMFEFGDQLATLKEKLTNANREYQIRAADHKRDLDLKIAQENRAFLWEVFSAVAGLLLLITMVWYHFYEKNARKKRLQRAIKRSRIVVPMPTS